MTNSEEIELSKEQQDLLDEIRSAIKQAKPLDTERFRVHLSFLRDWFTLSVLEKKLEGNNKYLADLTAAERVHDMVLKYEKEKGAGDGEQQEGVLVMKLECPINDEDIRTADSSTEGLGRRETEDGAAGSDSSSEAE